MQQLGKALLVQSGAAFQAMRVRGDSHALRGLYILARQVQSASRGMSQQAGGDVIGPGVTIQPKGTHTHTFIFLHGLGETGPHWLGVMEESVAPSHPSLKIMLPTAPLRPVTTLSGVRMHAWWDRVGYQDRANEPVRGKHEAAAAVEALIKKEVATGTPSRNIILGGYSQGAACAIYTSLRTRQRLGGLVAVNGYLPGLRTQPLAITERLPYPLLFCHGAADQQVRLEEGWRAFSILYTGSTGQLDADAAHAMRRMWAYPAADTPAESGGDGDDDIVSLRHRLTLLDGPAPQFRQPHVAAGLQGPACVLHGRSPQGYCAVRGSASSFVTFPSQGHDLSREMAQVMSDWLDHVMEPPPHTRHHANNPHSPRQSPHNHSSHSHHSSHPPHQQ